MLELLAEMAVDPGWPGKGEYGPAMAAAPDSAIPAIAARASIMLKR